MPVLVDGGQSIEYTVSVRPRRRRPGISVSSEGKLMVLLPPGADPSQAEALVRGNLGWIARHLPPPHSFAEGDRFWLLGRVQRLVLGASAVSSGAGQIAISAVDPSLVRQELIGWYRRHAAELLSERIQIYRQTMGVEIASVRLGDYASRWGYCRQDGRVAFNWRIIQADLSVVDYVVVHELAHRRWMDHQSRFWREVGETLPEYGLARSWLRNNGCQLLW